MDAGFDTNTATQTEQNTGYTAYHQTSAEQEVSRNATTAMVLGILGDVCSLLPLLNIGGLILSIIALVRANKNRRFARDNGIQEDGKNTAGRWCGIAGIILNGLSVLFWTLLIIVWFVLIAAFFANVGLGTGGVIPELF